MTKAEKEAKKAYKADIIAQGVNKELAEVMASIFIEYEIVKPVVNSIK